MEERTWTPSQKMAMKLDGKALLVSAAAGSGKTSVLTERIIRRLTDAENPADLSRMLVVTFTRAAAAELKSRIAAALTAALAKNPTDLRLQKQLLSLGSAQISTIDSFFQRLVRTNFETLGIPATFRVADENELLPIASRVMDDLVEEYYHRYGQNANPESAISQVQDNAFARCLDHLMSDRSDGKLQKLLLEFPEQLASYPNGIELLDRAAKQLRHDAECPFLSTRMGEKLSGYLLPLLSGFVSDLESFHNGWEHDPVCSQKCDGLWSTDLDFCRSLADAITAKDYGRAGSVARAFVKGTFPSRFEKVPAVNEYQAWRNFFKDRVDEIREMLGWSEDEIRIQSIQTAELCEMLYRFYSEYHARLLAEKHSRGILAHNDIREMVYRLLSNENGASSELAKSLSAQYDAVYIDEYQDVDLLQDRIFALIGGDRRFMVGDIKQSIYGFRGSDPSIFAAYRRSMPLYNTPKASTADGMSVFMSENFRCNRPVIDFANQVCAFLFSACEESVGYREEDDLYCSKKEVNPSPAPTTVAVFDMPPRRKKEEIDEGDSTDEESRALSGEAKWVAARISELLREETKDDGTPITPSDIAILVRTRAQGKPFIEAMQSLNIPVASESSDQLLRDPLLIDTVNFLRAIDNPYRDLPLSEFLLSPIGGFTLEELSVLRGASDNGHSLFDAMTDANASAIEPTLLQKTKRAVEWLTELQKSAVSLPADRFLRLLYLDERMIDYASEAPLLFLYDQARIYQRTSYCGLYGFLGHIEKVLENEKISVAGFAKAESAVSVMTVHHSKGLEFPVVFVGGCGGYFNRSDTYEKLLFHHATGCASKLYDRETGEHRKTVLHEVVRQEIDLEQTEEAIRTLYVALTRARERLFVTGTLRSKRENALAAADTVKRGSRAAILGCNSYLAWILAALKEPLTRYGVHRPTVLHFAQEEVAAGIPLEMSSDPKIQSKDVPSDPITAYYANTMRESATYCYPHATLHTLPTKVAASKLHTDLLDVLLDEAHEDEALEHQIALMEAATPSFDALLSDIDRPKPTEIGTATHAFLQFCDFSRLARDGIDTECARLVAEHFIDERTASIIHREQLEAFVSSNLMELIQKATRIRREQTFSLLLPLSRLTQNRELAESLGNETIFVQGSIDLLLEMPDGKLILVDYKTDRISDEERKNESLLVAHMQARHGEQLACYAEAVCCLFGRDPDRIYLYSLPLGRAIEMPITVKAP